MFCINKDVVPFDKNWSSKFRFKWKWNPGITILNALASLFDMHIFCIKTILSIKDIDVTLTKLISNCHAQQSLLWLMRKDLVESASKVHAQAGNILKQQVPKLGNLKSENFWNAVKPHLSTHIPFYKKLYGADKRSYDTELSEKSHIKFVKNVYEKSNKKTYDTHQQMLIYIRNSESLMMAENILDNDNNVIDSEVNTSTTTSYTDSMKNNMKIYQYDIRFFYGYENAKFSNRGLKITYHKGQRSITSLSQDFNCETLNTALISFQELSNLFDSNFEGINQDTAFISEWENVVFMKKSFRFLKSVEISYSVLQEDKFGLIADNSYRHFQDSEIQSSIFSFVEVKWEYEDSNQNIVSDSSIAQVISIINFNSNEFGQHPDDRGKIYLLIVWMKVIPSNTNVASVFPNFIQYRYDVIYSKNGRPKKLNMSIISINNVIRPACLIQYTESGNNWSYNNMTIGLNDLDKCVFYSVPYLYAKRDSLAYENSYQHWKYKNDNKTTKSNSNSSSNNNSSSTSSSSNAYGNFSFHNSSRSRNAITVQERCIGGFDISEKVYGAFLNEVEINEVDSYLKSRFNSNLDQTESELGPIYEEDQSENEYYSDEYDS
jgi:hypothetical protein